MRGVGCTGTAVKYFKSVKVLVNSQEEHHRHIYTCETCMKYIPIKEKNGKQSCPVVVYHEDLNVINVKSLAACDKALIASKILMVVVAINKLK